MNTPNKLTMLRIILVPFFVAFLLLTDIPHHYLFAGIVFALASFTDFLDGRIARKYNQITDFGKFADPLADKILIISAFVCFVQLGIMGAVPVIIVLFREFTVTSVRLVAAGKGTVVAANNWGKAKTVSQIIAVVFVILSQYVIQLIEGNILPLGQYAQTVADFLHITGSISIWISVLFTLVSGVIYVKDNYRFFAEQK